MCCFLTFARVWKDKRRDAKMIVTTDCSYLHLKLESITSLHEKNHVLFWNSWRPMRNSLFASQLYLNFSRNFYQIALCLDPKQSWSNQNTKKTRILANWIKIEPRIFSISCIFFFCNKITWHFRSGREKAEISPKFEIKRRQFSEMLEFWNKVKSFQCLKCKKLPLNLQMWSPWIFGPQLLRWLSPCTFHRLPDQGEKKV